MAEGWSRGRPGEVTARAFLQIKPGLVGAGAHLGSIPRADFLPMRKRNFSFSPQALTETPLYGWVKIEHLTLENSMTDFDMKSMDDGQRIIAMMLAHARVARNLQVDYDYKKGVLVVDISGMPEQYCYHAEIRFLAIDKVSVLVAMNDGEKIYEGVFDKPRDSKTVESAWESRYFKSVGVEAARSGMLYLEAFMSEVFLTIESARHISNIADEIRKSYEEDASSGGSE